MPNSPAIRGQNAKTLGFQKSYEQHEGRSQEMHSTLV
jgi:hypothetical protein